jgi:hypothetical protein
MSYIIKKAVSDLRDAQVSDFNDDWRIAGVDRSYKMQYEPYQRSEAEHVVEILNQHWPTRYELVYIGNKSAEFVQPVAQQEIKTTLFTVVDDAQVVMQSKGTYRQGKVFSRTVNGHTALYGKWGSGYIRLTQGGHTSNPLVRWDHVEAPVGFVLKETGRFGNPQLEKFQ